MNKERKEKIEKITKLYKEGYSYKQIGEMIGMSKSGVGYILRTSTSVDTSRNLSNYDTRKYKVDDNYFENIDTEDKAYTLGFIMADGCVLENRTLNLCIHKQDEYILKRFLKNMKSTYKIQNHKDNYRRITISSKKIVDDLTALGVVYRKTKTLKMPIIKEDLYKHLIRGYFDGDGSIWYDKSVNSYRVQFLGTLNIIETIQGFFGNYTKLRPTSQENIIFRYGFSGNVKVSNLLSKIYDGSTICLDRKYQKYVNCTKLKKQ